MRINGMWWKIILLSGLAAVIVFSFITPAPQNIIGEASRIFYYHIPMAWIAVLAFALAMIYSIRYLRSKKIIEDIRARSAASLGLLFSFLATVSGSIFARVTWGSFWNWDPRETSIFILLLIYGAYFALRTAVAVEEKRASLAAVYAIFAFLTVPFLVFVVPRVVPSLHPADSVIGADFKFTMGTTVRLIFFASLAFFTVLYLWLFNLTCRVGVLYRKIIEEESL
ncbi:MAG: cytochrome c biogenesis protein CcsA [candidate division Zixibacteria bacterium]|nr:cytochrome c biogenesis protein CcsA [candidate division Zixibacteria bacterium]MDD5426405.1 cytochrome c biogenesis protein CcsA [candidate division Zixibacteria bacterium]